MIEAFQPSTACSISREPTFLQCIALLHGAKAKVVAVDNIPLFRHINWPNFVDLYRIGVVNL
jgi:hypothetical protein